jgi:hypothetical protein
MEKVGLRMGITESPREEISWILKSFYLCSKSQSSGTQDTVIECLLKKEELDIKE